MAKEVVELTTLGNAGNLRRESACCKKRKEASPCSPANYGLIQFLGVLSLFALATLFEGADIVLRSPMAVPHSCLTRSESAAARGQNAFKAQDVYRDCGNLGCTSAEPELRRLQNGVPQTKVEVLAFPTWDLLKMTLSWQ